MADRKITYQVGFQANTSQLQKAVDDAVKALQKLEVNGYTGGLSKQLDAAAASAGELAVMLQRAWNVDTGKLDLTRFRQSLKDSGQDLNSFYNRLKSLGPEGERSFIAVGNAIAQAELPLKRTNAWMDKLWTTMQNTLRWQLTSSMLNSFIGALQTSYGYAQDLNESLNNIRIVTGQNTEQMARFAEQANKAAHTLSTTTLDYTDAALIYYQQGLTDQEVEDRTNVTIKLANAARESAEYASEQLTAIWNNFYDGTRTLESYADALVALGASTASSSEEISAGVQKFAAVANTVGLSYDYATAALATLTATTRESADIIGTSLRTLFARFSSLKLGETLEDGVDLNKYTQALATVGVNVLDANGNLKEMDDILDSTMSKWHTLTEAQKTALATTVAGVRQYSQFMALMENSDFFYQNVATARGSEGALQEQANIYAESWEAARDRVKNATQDISDSLFDDQMFIDLDNGLTPLLHGIAEVVDGMKGLEGIIPLVAASFSTLYSDKIAQSMRDMAVNASIAFGFEQKKTREFQQQAFLLADQTAQALLDNENEQSLQNLLATRLQYYQYINKNQDLLNSRQKEYLNEQKADFEELQVKAEELIAEYEKITNINLVPKKKLSPEQIMGNYQDVIKKYNQPLITDWDNDYRQKNKRKQNPVKNVFDDMLAGSASYEKIIQAEQRLRNKFFNNTEMLGRLKAVKSAYDSIGDSAEKSSVEVQDLATKFGLTGEEYKSIDKINEKINSLEKTLPRITEELSAWGYSEKDINTVSTAMQAWAEKGIDIEQVLDLLGSKFGQLREGLDARSGMDWAERLTQVSSAAMRVYSAFNAIKNIGSIWSNQDLSTGEKLLQTLGAVAMLAPSLTAGLAKVHAWTKKAWLEKDKETASNIANTVAKMGNAAASGAEAVGDSQVTKEAEKAAAAKLKEAAATNVANLAVGGALVLITALVAGYATYQAWQQSIIDAAQEAADKAKEHSDNIKEEADSLRDQIKEMQRAYEAYKENEENKEALDEATLKLANSYGLEGGALATLTGEYGDYNNVLDQAIKKQEELIHSQKLALTAQQNAVKAAYEAAHSGFLNLGSSTSSIAYNSELYGYLTSQGITQISGNETGGNFRFGVNFEEDLKLYQAIEELADRDGDLYKEARQKFADFLKACETEIKEYNANAETLKVTSFLDIGENRISQVTSISEMEAWISRAENFGLTEQQIIAAINDSANAAVKDLYTYSRAIDDINNKAQTWGIAKDAINLQKIFASDDWEKSGLLAIDWDLYWAAVSKDTDNAQTILEDFYNSALRAVELTNQLAEANERLDTLKSIQNVLNKKKLDFLDEDTFNKLYDFDWETLGDETVKKYADFINKTSAEQTLLTQRALSQTQTEIFNTLLAQRQEALATINANKGILDDKETIARYQDILANADTAMDIRRQAEEKAAGREAGTSFASAYNKAVKEILEQRGLNKTDFSESNQDILTAYSGEFESHFKERTDSIYAKSTKVSREYLATVKEVQDATDSLAKTKKELEHQRLLAWEQHIEATKNSTGSLVNLLNTISNGIKVITDEAGNKVETLSIDAFDTLSEYIPNLYELVEVTAAGTFQLTKGMYDEYFDLENGRLTTILKNTEAELKAKIDVKEAEITAIDAVIARGEKESQSVAENAAEQVAIWHSENMEVAAGNAIMSNEVTNSLGQIDTKIETVATNLANELSNASKTAAINAVNNFNDITGALGNIARAQAQVAQNARNQYGAIYNEAFFKSYKRTAGDNLPYQLNNLENGNETTEDNAESNNINELMRKMEEALANQDQVTANKLFEQYKSRYKAQYLAGTSAVDLLKKNRANLQDEVNALLIAQARLRNALYPDKNTGGSGGSKALSKLADELTEVIKRYHYITREIETQERILKSLDTAIDRAYGIKRLDLYSRRLKELTKLQALQQEKLNLAEFYVLDDQKNLLTDYFSDLQFDANHELINYDDLAMGIITTYNKTIDEINKQYGKRVLSEEEKTARDQALDDAKTLKEKSQQALKTYEEGVDVWHEMEEAVKETARAIQDTELDTIEAKLQFKVDAKEMREVVRNFRKSVEESIGETWENGAKVLALTLEGADDELSMLASYRDSYSELMQQLEQADNDEDYSRIQSKIKELQSDMATSGDAILQAIDDWENAFVDALDSATERFNKYIDALGHNSSVAATIKELMELQGLTYKTEKGFAAVQQASRAQLQATLAQGRLQKQEWESLKDLYSDAIAELDAFDGDPMLRDRLVKNADALREQMNAAEEAMLSSAKEAMELAREMYETQIEEALYSFDRIVSNNQGLDFLKNQFDHYIDTEERYFDQVNTAYEITNWQTKLQADIDKTVNAGQKARLKVLQDEINVRAENNTLNQYDLDILEAKYNQMQAIAALEDARDNKNTLRLVRDSQGNWNYQYTNNPEDVAKAEQDLAKANNDYYNVAKKQTQQITSDIIDMWTEARDAIKDAYNIEDIEERQKKIAEITEYYTQKAADLEHEKQVAIKDMTEAGNLVIDGFSNTYASDLGAMTQNNKDFKDYLKETVDKCEEYYKGYQGTVHEVTDETGIDTNTLTTRLGELKDSTHDLATDGSKDWDKIIGKVQNFKQQIDNSIGAIKTLIEKLSELNGDGVGSLNELTNANDIIERYQSFNKNIDYSLMAAKWWNEMTPEQQERAYQARELKASTLGMGQSFEKFEDFENYINGINTSGYNEKVLNDMTRLFIEEGLLDADRVSQNSTNLEDINTNTEKTADAVQKIAAISEGDKKGSEVSSTQPKEQEPVNVNNGIPNNEAWKSHIEEKANTLYEENIPNEEKAFVFKIDNGIVNYLKTLTGTPEEIEQMYNEILERDYQNKWKYKLKYSSYDTGGYTGEFSNGRLALLHEKELVLNQEDTKNILAAVTLTRAMVSQLEHAIDGSAAAGMALMGSRLSSGVSVPAIGSNLDQTIHIDSVEFPNATSASEIQEAFRNIADNAVQWARQRKS